MTTHPGRVPPIVPEFDAAALLRRARRIADLSQRDLAARAGVSRSAVAKAELGAGTSFAMMLSLFAAAGIKFVPTDQWGEAIAPMRNDSLRDAGDRRYPAHLDPASVRSATYDKPWLWRDNLFNRMSRYDRPRPVVLYELRPQRDWRRRRYFEPYDHPGPEALRLRDLPPLQPKPPLPDCECPIECERECVPECPCQCEPLHPPLAA
jgi:HTH-type transcriptional regulator/antitoxin HipB